MNRTDRRTLVLNAAKNAGYPFQIVEEGKDAVTHAVTLNDEQSAFAFVNNAPDGTRWALVPKNLDAHQAAAEQMFDIPAADETSYEETSDPDEEVSQEVSTFFTQDELREAKQLSHNDISTVLCSEIGYHELGGRFPIGSYVTISETPHMVVDDTVKLNWQRNIKAVQARHPNQFNNDTLDDLANKVYSGKIVETLDERQLQDFCNYIRGLAGELPACCDRDQDGDGNCDKHLPIKVEPTVEQHIANIKRCAQALNWTNFDLVRFMERTAGKTPGITLAHVDPLTDDLTEGEIAKIAEDQFSLLSKLLPVRLGILANISIQLSIAVEEKVAGLKTTILNQCRKLKWGATDLLKKISTVMDEYVVGATLATAVPSVPKQCDTPGDVQTALNNFWDALDESPHSISILTHLSSFIGIEVRDQQIKKDVATVISISVDLKWTPEQFRDYVGAVIPKVKLPRTATTQAVLQTALEKTLTRQELALLHESIKQVRLKHIHVSTQKSIKKTAAATKKLTTATTKATKATKALSTATKKVQLADGINAKITKNVDAYFAKLGWDKEGMVCFARKAFWTKLPKDTRLAWNAICNASTSDQKRLEHALKAELAKTKSKTAKTTTKAKAIPSTKASTSKGKQVNKKSSKQSKARGK